MTQSRLWAFALIVCGLGIRPAAQEAQVLRTQVDIVRLDVTVTDRTGVFVEGLSQEDFEVLDNDRLQPITGFSSGHSPLTATFLLDMSDSMMPHTLRLGAAAGAFIDALKPGDRASVSSLMTVHPLRSDATALHHDLSRLTLGEGSMIWRSIERAAATIAGSQGRQAILLSTDGLDDGDLIRELHPQVRLTGSIASLIDPGMLDLSSKKAAGSGLESRAVQLYVVALEGARVTGELRKLAEDSGGRVVRVQRDDNLARVFETTVKELHLQYLLSYAAPERDGAVHAIKVRVKRPGLTVRSRRTYVAGKQ